MCFTEWKDEGKKYIFSKTLGQSIIILTYLQRNRPGRYSVGRAVNYWWFHYFKAGPFNRCGNVVTRRGCTSTIIIYTTSSIYNSGNRYSTLQVYKRSRPDNIIYDYVKHYVIGKCILLMNWKNKRLCYNIFATTQIK